MFRFPFTNFHELNLDWILSVVKQAQEVFTTGAADIAHAVEAADQALTVAEQAASGVIGDGAVTTAKLANNAVSGAKIADSAVTGAKIADNAVTGAKIADNAVTNAKIADNAVTGDKIAAGTLTSLSCKYNKLLLIGDSYNAGVGGTPGRGWGYYLTNLFDSASSTIVSQNGGGFVIAGNSNATYPGKTYAELITDLPAENYDLVIVMSGWNDASLSTNPTSGAQIESAVASCINNLRTKYPHARIIVMPCYNDTYPLNKQQARLLTIAKAAAKNRVDTCFDSYLWMQNSGLNSGDNIHLIDSGYRLLAYYLYNFVTGWSGNINFVRDITSQVNISSPAGVTLGANLRIIVDKTQCYISGDITLTETLADWTRILDKVPACYHNVIITSLQWTTDFKRPLRGESNIGNHTDIRYGEAGNYRLSFTYPIDLETLD